MHYGGRGTVRPYPGQVCCSAQQLERCYSAVAPRPPIQVHHYIPFSTCVLLRSIAPWRTRSNAARCYRRLLRSTSSANLLPIANALTDKLPLLRSRKYDIVRIIVAMGRPDRKVHTSSNTSYCFPVPETCVTLRTLVSLRRWGDMELLFT